ncbi:macro domain-containing protein [Paenarthrobacter nitroguajacolicus]
MARKWTRRQSKATGQRFLAALGFFAVPIGILAPLAPQWWDGKWWLVLGVLAVAVGWTALGLRRKEPNQRYRENVTIRLVVGDLFTQDASPVIGMTATFDTRVPEVIAPTSVQGLFLKTIYDGSQERLDADLDRALANVKPEGMIAKPGKQAVYPLGTVATLNPPGRLRYYCAAYTRMDEKNRASGTIRSVLDSLDNSWEEADVHGNGDPICVPVIGQGQSRIPELTPEISIRLIAFSFLLRSKKSRFASELRIVVHPTERDKINFPEFQAFLTSLAAS